MEKGCLTNQPFAVSLDEDRPVDNRTRSISLEMVNSQPDNMASSGLVSVQKRVGHPSEVSLPRKRVKQIDPTLPKSANEIQRQRPSLVRSTQIHHLSKRWVKLRMAASPRYKNIRIYMAPRELAEKSSWNPGSFQGLPCVCKVGRANLTTSSKEQICL